MPRKTGVLFYRQMKSVPELRSIPVIVITGLRGLNDNSGPFVERFFEVDKLPVPDAFLGKPLEKETFLSVVKAKLGASASDPQGR
jgi:CheY-like chemotaxis protein